MARERRVQRKKKVGPGEGTPAGKSPTQQRAQAGDEDSGPARSESRATYKQKRDFKPRYEDRPSLRNESQSPYKQKSKKGFKPRYGDSASARSESRTDNQKPRREFKRRDENRASDRNESQTTNKPKD